MTVRKILKMGDPRLLRVAEPVTRFDTPELHALLQDMRETMLVANGAGLAAPQIGVNFQVVIFGSGQKNPRYPDALPVPRTVLINPVITPIFKENTAVAFVKSAQSAIESIAFDLHFSAPMESQELGWEGCLSVPGLRGEVPRFKAIRYQGFDEFGQPFDRTVDGFHARVVQHECDHLHGILYPMRVRDFRRFGFTDILFPELSGNQDDD
jgi:peptide deformylase